MEAVEARRAVDAAVRVAVSCGLAVDEAVVLNDSNRLVVRLTPCSVVARIIPLGYRVFPEAVGASGELQVVERLGDVGAPVATLASGVEQRAFAQDGFEIELLTYYEPRTRDLPPDEYANALERLHGAMRRLDVEAPHFTDRVQDVERWLSRRDETPDLIDDDRVLLIHTLRSLREAVTSCGSAEQLLHGEPHPWNVLDTESGPRFVDFENCVRGPREWDLGWVPSEVAERYARADRELVISCRGLVLAVVAAHCWRPADERPGREARGTFTNAVRKGPPWTALDAL